MLRQDKNRSDALVRDYGTGSVFISEWAGLDLHIST